MVKMKLTVDGSECVVFDLLLDFVVDIRGEFVHDLFDLIG